jgi:hypothetical protein
MMGDGEGSVGVGAGRGDSDKRWYRLAQSGTGSLSRRSGSEEEARLGVLESS